MLLLSACRNPARSPTLRTHLCSASAGFTSATCDARRGDNQPEIPAKLSVAWCLSGGMQLVFHQCNLIQFVRDADGLGEPDQVTAIPTLAKFCTITVNRVAATPVFHLPFTMTLMRRWRRCLLMKNFIVPCLFQET